MSAASGTPPDSGKAAAAAAAPPREPNRVVAAWRGEHRFDAGRPGGPTVRIDASGKTGPGPVDSLLIALATCVSVDVVDILTKRRTPPASLEVEVAGWRVSAVPRKLERALITFRIAGAGIDREPALRAIELAVTKYCSVRDSLDPNVPVEWALELVEEPAET